MKIVQGYFHFSKEVPQGSILGTLLFSVYINDLPFVLKYCKINMYADDVQMYTSCDLYNLNDGIANMNSDLNRVWQWAAGNELSLNPCKSKSILISRQKLDHVCIPQIKMNGSCVELVDQVKNLGIIFTKDLLWTAHINTAVGKVYDIMGDSEVHTIAYPNATCEVFSATNFVLRM